MYAPNVIQNAPHVYVWKSKHTTSLCPSSIDLTPLLVIFQLIHFISSIPYAIFIFQKNYIREEKSNTPRLYFPSVNFQSARLTVAVPECRRPIKTPKFHQAIVQQATNLKRNTSQQSQSKSQKQERTLGVLNSARQAIVVRNPLAPTR